MRFVQCIILRVLTAWVLGIYKGNKCISTVPQFMELYEFQYMLKITRILTLGVFHIN